MVFPIGKLGRCIKDFRELWEFSVQELATKAGISASHLRKLERGARTPTLDTLFKIIDVFEMTPATFFLFHTETEERDLDYIVNVYPDELTKTFQKELGWSVIGRTK